MTESETRFQWMDTLRGFAIILVIVWHAPAIPALFDYEMPFWLERLNDFFLPFRMPTLMFLSGLLLAKSLRKSRGVYYIGKFRSLIWPYLLWSALHIVIYADGLILSSPRSWIATGYLWFLFYIACYYLAAPLVMKLPAWLVPLILLAASIPIDDGLPKKFLYFGAFFFAGHFASQQRDLFVRVTRGRVLPYLGAVAIAFGTFSALNGDQFAYRGEFALFSLAGILAAISLTEKAGEAAWLAPVAFIGRNSLVYYVSHFPIILGVKYLLEAFGIHSIWSIAICGAVLAFGLGTALAKYRIHVPINWLFQAPTLPRLKNQVGPSGLVAHIGNP